MALVIQDRSDVQHQQHSTFIVELPNPGYKIKRNIKNMAIEGPHADVIHGGIPKSNGDLDPADNLLGGEGNGFNMGKHRLATAGCATACTISRKPSARWTWRSRTSQNVRPRRKLLADRQAVQFMLAECASQLYIGRLMLLHIAYKAEKGSGFAAGKLDREGVSGAHGTPCDRHRDPAARRARLQPGYDPGEVVHPGPLAAAGRRPDEVHRWRVGRNVIKAFREHGTTASAAGGDLI
jgi:acyl-CoA dehydrogenase